MSHSDIGETLSKPQKFKEHCEQNKGRIIQGVMARKMLIRGSDEYMKKQREFMIHALNTGERKFITTKIKEQFNIRQDRRTLEYY